MRPRALRLGLIAIALIAACGGETADDDGARRDGDGAGGLAQPPSADAPRAQLPNSAPDTVRGSAGSDTTLVEEFGPAPPPAPRGGVDVPPIVEAYRQYYIEEFHERGSSVAGGVDPALVSDAKRRTALDYGFVEVGAWPELVSTLQPEQRVALAARIEETNRGLAVELH
ncbi:MAG: hypothetical protein ABR559_00455 [Gemmatimonadota bacterium]